MITKISKGHIVQGNKCLGERKAGTYEKKNLCNFRVARESPRGKMTFNQKYKGREGVHHLDIQ